MTEPVVVDASAVVDLLLGADAATAVSARLRHCALHAPAHLDAEVLSALGRVFHAGYLSSEAVERRLGSFTSMPLMRHPLAPLLAGAWGRRDELRLVDALYVELSAHLETPLITTDQRLSRAAPLAELITA